MVSDGKCLLFFFLVDVLEEELLLAELVLDDPTVKFVVLEEVDDLVMVENRLLLTEFSVL